jgi:hypothetical protein
MSRMKTPRNHPCPCGSGKKHKRCCGSAESQMRARREYQERLERVREARRQRLIEQGQNPSLAGLASIIAASVAMKRP